MAKKTDNFDTAKLCPSQLRFDEVSRDWVVIAPGRGKRPEAFIKSRQRPAISPAECVFCNINHETAPLLLMSHGRKIDLAAFAEWTLAVIPNKFPAFCPPQNGKINKVKVGPYQIIDAVGFCEVVITRDHEKSIAQMNDVAVKELMAAYLERYLELKNNGFVKYISIFHNHGVEAGASQVHPHSQIITSPLIDVDVHNALENSKKYYQKHKKCLSCEMTAWDKKEGSRIVCENDDFIAVCPFAPKAAFQVIITPKIHMPNFESISPEQLAQLANIFSIVLKKVHKGLGDPPYNFYLHTAPNDGKDYSFYHWHFTVMPRTGVWAGFELGARIEISTITPENAAAYLRAQEV